MDDRDEIRLLNAKVHGFRAMFQDYKALADIREDLHMLVERDNAASEGGVMTLIGPSGCGKTKFIEDFLEGYPREPHAIRHEDGRIADRATVVLVAVPDTGVKTLAEEIYTALTGFDPPADRRFDLQKAIYQYAAEMQTRLVIFEEAHEASVDDTNRTVRAVARLLKQFSNKATFATLIVGTEDAYRLVRVNKELRRRLLGKHTIPPLAWDVPASRKVFRSLLRKWDVLLQEVFVPAGLDDERLAVRIHLSSDGGVIGLAAVLVERAALLAARDKVAGRMRGEGRNAVPILGIDEVHLHQAHRLLGRAEPNPFRSDLLDEDVPLAPRDAGEADTDVVAAADLDAAQTTRKGEGVERPLPKRSSRRAARDRTSRP